MKWYSLRVDRIVTETAESVSVYFALPAQDTDAFVHRAGQYVTIEAPIEKKPIRRAYSICTAPHEDRFGITVKRVEGGKLSTYLVRRLRTGDILQVSPPEGRFVLNPTSSRIRLFGAGSGITPLYAMLKSYLHQVPEGQVVLHYGNRDATSVIYAEQLAELGQRYSFKRLQLHLVYSRSGPSDCASGRIDTHYLKRFGPQLRETTSDEEFYLCGPNEMIDTVRQYLQNMGVNESRIHHEKFVLDAPSEVPLTTALTATVVVLDDETHELFVPRDRTVLRALLDRGHDAPYSCGIGSCSTCIGRVVEGTVHMPVCESLDADELADGYILTCQAYPTSATLRVSFDD